MRIPTLRCVWVRERPALENLPRTKLRRSGGTYGESALTLDATAMSVCQLALFTTLDTRKSRPFGPETSALSGGIPRSSILNLSAKRRRLSSEIVCTLHISNIIAVKSGRIWQWITISFRKRLIHFVQTLLTSCGHDLFFHDILLKYRAI